MQTQTKWGDRQGRLRDILTAGRSLLEREVYVPPSQFEALFPSTAHGDEEIERTVDALESFGR